MKSVRQSVILLFLLLMYFPLGCSSDDGGNDPGINPLIGTWELTQGRGNYLGTTVTVPASTIQLIMTIELKSNARYLLTFKYQDETTFEEGSWSSTETTITLIALTNEVAVWPYTIDGNTLVTTVDTQEFGLRDLGITAISGVWNLYFEK